MCTKEIIINVAKNLYIKTLGIIFFQK
jgi:hypothetical protein